MVSGSDLKPGYHNFSECGTMGYPLGAFFGTTVWVHKCDFGDRFLDGIPVDYEQKQDNLIQQSSDEQEYASAVMGG